MAVWHLSRGNDEGTVLGQSTTDKVGFYGLATPIAQPSVTHTSVATTLANRLEAALVSLGLIVTT